MERSVTENRPSNARHDDDAKPSRLAKAAKVAGQVSGASVLAKDFKRMRPRYPSMWVDLVSPKKWGEAFSHKRAEKQPLASAVYTVAFSWVIGLGVIFYALAFIGNPEWAGNASSSSKIALLVLVGLAGLQIVTYSLILAIKLKRQFRNEQTESATTPQEDKRKC